MSMLSSYTKFDLYFTINLVAYIQHYKFVYPARENGDVQPVETSVFQASSISRLIHISSSKPVPQVEFHVFTDDAVSEGHILVDELKTISLIKAWMKKADVYTCSPPVYGPTGEILFNGYSRPITWQLFSSGLQVKLFNKYTSDDVKNWPFTIKSWLLIWQFGDKIILNF